MEKVCIHIGLSLFAIKKLCESQSNCANCPLLNFCSNDGWGCEPSEWHEDFLPDAGLVLDLTDDNKSDIIKSSSPD